MLTMNSFLTEIMSDCGYPIWNSPVQSKNDLPPNVQSGNVGRKGTGVIFEIDKPATPSASLPLEYAPRPFFAL